MSSHTNVTLPDRHSTISKLISDKKLLEFKLREAEERIDWMEFEFANIPAAIIEWGYVEIKYNYGKDTMKIGRIDSPTETTKAGT